MDLLRQRLSADKFHNEELPSAGFGARSFKASPKFALSVGIYAGLLARTGQTGRASELLKELGNTEPFLVPQAWGLYHVCVDEIGKAVDWFEKAIVQRDTWLLL